MAWQFPEKPKNELVFVSFHASEGEKLLLINYFSTSKMM